MKITVEDKGANITRLEKEEIEKKIPFYFSRIANNIHRVQITLQETDSPNGSVDKECTVTIESELKTPLIIRDKRETTTQAVTSALHRANHSFVRQWKRKGLLAE